MEQFLRSLPRWATIVSICVAGGGMAMRSAWPTRGEALVLAATVACICGMRWVHSARMRSMLAGLWVATIIYVANRLVPPGIGMDFQTFVDGASLLFEGHQSPYLARGTTAFPFPTFVLVRALTLGGALTLETTLWVFLTIQVILLALSYVLVRRVIAQERLPSGPDLTQALIQGGLILHPAILLVLYYGQSSILAAASLIVAIWCWRCGNTRAWLHGAAIFLNLAWMIKPQLLMAAGFFLVRWLRDAKGVPLQDNRDAAIGRLVVPWCAALIALSLVGVFPGHGVAYQNFFHRALSWHTVIAEISPNNYAISAIMAKAGKTVLGFSVDQTLPVLTFSGALLIVLWGCLSLQRAKPDSLLAFTPWLLASLLWTSLVWRFYLSLVLASLLLLVAYESMSAPSRFSLKTLWLATGIGLTYVLGSFAFTLGILILFFLSHELLVEETAAFHDDGNVEKAV